MNDSVQGDWTGRGRLKGNTLAWCKAQLSGPVVRLDQRVHRPKVPTATPDMGLWFNPLAGDSEPNVDLQCRWALADRSAVLASDDHGRKQGLLRHHGSTTNTKIDTVTDLRSRGVTDQLLREQLSGNDGESKSGLLSGLLNCVVQRFLGTMAMAYLTCIILGVDEVHAAPEEISA